MNETGQPLFMLRPADLISNSSAVNVAVREDARHEVERATGSAEDDVPPVEDDDACGAQWNAIPVRELLRRLDEEGAVRADIIRRAAALGGAIDRTEICEMSGYDEDRMLRGFARPTVRFTKELQTAGVLEPGVTPILTPRYFTGVIAQLFVIPSEVVDLLSS